MNNRALTDVTLWVMYAIAHDNAGTVRHLLPHLMAELMRLLNKWGETNQPDAPELARLATVQFVEDRLLVLEVEDFKPPAVSW